MKVRKFRILVADDDPIVKIIWDDFSSDRYDIIFTANGKTILECDLKDIDIILMDINMPDLSGIELTKIIRSRGEYGQKIPIIAITAHVNKELIRACMDAGIDEVLNKPLLPKDLEAVIVRWLNK